MAFYRYFASKKLAVLRVLTYYRFRAKKLLYLASLVAQLGDHDDKTKKPFLNIGDFSMSEYQNIFSILNV